MARLMLCATAISELPDTRDAIAEAAAALSTQLGGEAPDLTIAFASAHHAKSYDSIPDLVHHSLRCGTLMGCSGGGVIGEGQEVEQRPGLALFGGIFPDVAIVPFHVTPHEIPSAELSTTYWPERLNVVPDQQPDFLLLPDPFSCDPAQLVGGLDLAYPRATKVGGLASGARQPGDNALFLNDTVHREGAVGLAMYGDVEIDSVVAQGCRPFGPSLKVTRAERNLIFGLNDRPCIKVLEEIFVSASDAARERFSQSPVVGICPDTTREKPQHGDFLIRHLMGFDREAGAIGVAAVVEQDQIIQLHVRDASSAAVDLETMLGRHRRETSGAEPKGALLFSCLGRGEGFYGTPNHDSDMFEQIIGPLPLSGFFCSGEIGPIHGKTYLHGYTSAFALFRPRGWS